MFGGPPPAIVQQSMALAAQAQRKEETKVDPNAPKPLACNSTGGVETDDGRILYGLDAEIYLKLKAKEDPDWELKVGQWIEKVLEKSLANPADLHVSLKDGIILCELINKLKPGTIKKINSTAGMLRHLAERDNISLYLKGCYTLGIDNSSMFTIADLHTNRGKAAVLANIAALSQLAHSVLKCPIEPLGPAISSQTTGTTSIEHSQRSFKWSVDTSYLTKTMAGEAEGDGVAALEEELKEAKERVEEEANKLSRSKRARRLLIKGLDREKSKIKDIEREVHHLRSNTLVDAFIKDLTRLRDEILREVKELEAKQGGEELKMKLMAELQTAEHKFDEECSVRLKTLNDLSSAIEEAGQKATMMKETIGNSTKDKEELDNKIAEAQQNLDREALALRQFEDTIKDLQQTHSAEIALLKSRVDASKAQHQNLLTEKTNSEAKLRQDMKTNREQTEARLKNIQKNIDEFVQRKNDFSTKTADEKKRIVDELKTSLQTTKTQTVEFQNQLALLDSEKSQQIQNFNQKLASLSASKETVMKESAIKLSNLESKLAEAKKKLKEEEEVSASQFQAVEAQIKENKAEFTEQNEKNQQKLAQITAQSKAALSDAQHEVDTLNREIQKLHENNASSDLDFKRKMEALAQTSTQHIEKLQREADDLNQKISKLQAEHHSFKEKIKAESTKIAETQDVDKTETHTQIEQINHLIDQVRAQTEQEKQKLQQSHQQVLAQLQASFSSYEKQAEDLNSQLQKISSSVSSDTAKKQAELNATQNDIRRLTNEILSLRREKAQLMEAEKTKTDQFQNLKQIKETELKNFLQESSEDLERLEEDLADVKAEIQKQLKETQEYAESRYNATKSEIEMLEQSAIEQEEGQEAAIQELQQEMDELKEKSTFQITTLKQRIKDLLEQKAQAIERSNQNKDSVDSEILHLKDEYDQVESEGQEKIASLKRELESLHESTQEIVRQIGTKILEAKNEFTASCNEYHNSISEIMRRKDEIEFAHTQAKHDIERSISGLEYEKKEIEDEVAALQEEMEQNNNFYTSSLNSLRADFQARAEVMDDEILGAKELQTVLNAQYAELQTVKSIQDTQFKEELAALKQANEEINNAIPEASQALQKSAFEISQLHSELSQLHDLVSQYQTKLDESNQEIETISTQTDKLRSKETQLKNKRLAVRELTVSLIAENEEIKAKIEYLQRPRQAVSTQEDEEVAVNPKEEETKRKQAWLDEVTQDLSKFVQKHLESEQPWNAEAAQTMLGFKHVFDEESGRRAFTKILEESATHSHEVTPGSFDALFSLISLCLGKLDLTTGADTISAQSLIEACSKYKKKGSRETMQDFIKGNKCWDNVEFWESYFWSSVITKFKTVFGDMQDEQTYSTAQRRFFLDEVVIFSQGLWGWGKEMTVDRIVSIIQKLMEVIEFTATEKQEIMRVKDSLGVLESEKKQAELMKAQSLSKITTPRAEPVQSLHSPRNKTIPSPKEKKKPDKTKTPSERASKFGFLKGLSGKKEEVEKEPPKPTEHTEVSLGLCFCTEDYSSKDSNLSYLKGDFIIVFQKYPTGWWKGVVHRTGQTGLFQPGKAHLISQPEGEPEIVVALEDHTTIDATKLNFKKGEMLQVIEKLPNGNFKGKKTTGSLHSGLFPCKFTAPTLKVQAVAIESHESKEPGKLPFAKGDEVFVFQQAITGMWRGWSNGKSGIFPGNKVEFVDPALLATRRPSAAPPMQQDANEKRAVLKRALTNHHNALEPK